MKRSNPKRSVPHPKGAGVAGKRSSTDFAGSSARRTRRLGASASLEVWQTESARRVSSNNGDSMPPRVAPKPPPMMALNELLFEMPTTAASDMPEALYGQYPRGFIERVLPWLRCARHEILHICSGSLPPGEGIRVDIRPEAKPDVLADGRNLPRDRFPDGSVAAVLLDPPYSEDYAKSLYGVEYPRPSHLLAEAARVVRRGGRIAIVHYIPPLPPPGTSVVKVFGMSTGFNMPMRAVTIYERHQPELAL
jgi:hypothetical protein